MAALRAALVAVLLVPASPAAADPLDRWTTEIAGASARFGVPVEWIRRVMRAESGGETMLNGRPITSRAGAMGLMQLMPGTWQEMRAALGLGADPHHPRDNILAGTAYLRMMYNRFGYPGLFAAYNAGPARYSAYLERGRPLPAETLAYVAAVANRPSVGTPPDQRAAAARSPTNSALFAVLSAGEQASVQAPLTPQLDEGALFVTLRGDRP